MRAEPKNSYRIIRQQLTVSVCRSEMCSKEVFYVVVVKLMWDNLLCFAPSHVKLCEFATADITESHEHGLYQLELSDVLCFV